MIEREELFCKLIRDADKLDILYVLGEEKYKKLLYQGDEDISKELEKTFYNNVQGNIKNVKSKNDSLVIVFSYIYDINFKETYKIIYENKYYDKIYQRIDRKDIFLPYLEHVKEYLKERID